MADQFGAVRVTDRVYWVGAIDWAIRNFHGYATSRGTTYNAFLVLADKVTLIDTVKAPFRRELMARIASVIDPRRIEYVVSNHSEMDHSGCLPEVAAAVGAEKVFASRHGAAALKEHFGEALEIEAVEDGQELDLGNEALRFFETRMCHWPDSMVSYLAGDELLFSQDAFGMHLASSERFDDELPDWVLDGELAKYYANILMPLSAPVRKALDKLTGSGLRFRLVAPDHGPIWRKRFGDVLDCYARWSAGRRTNKAVVAYDTMWQSTDLMARAIGDGLAAEGSAVQLMPLSACHRSDVATELLDTGALLVGSPTINNTMFPTVADVLCYLRGLKPLGLIGAAFGSFGWSGESVKHVAAALEEMGVEQVGQPVRVKYVPTAADLEACRQLGREVAWKLKELYPPVE
ncbi:MAG TPA: FprA family A-type flavoprotein [Phycisphaerae bacterium]|nr:FprA family A-type flavoprotein [Phycisphaerae bacterium]